MMMTDPTFTPLDHQQAHKRWMVCRSRKDKAKDLKKKQHRKMAKKSRRLNRR